MATTLQDRVPPRRKMATYGKAARRRIPHFGFTSMARKSQTPDIEMLKEVVESPAPTLLPSVTPKKLNSPVRRPPSTTSRSPPSSSGDIFDVPDSDEDTPALVQKMLTPPRKTKPKPIRQPVAPSVLSGSSSTSDIWNMPECRVLKTARQRATTPAKLKPHTRKSTSVNPPAHQNSDVFDVPSSVDERQAIRAKRSLKTMQKQFATHTSDTVEVSDLVVGGSKKKLRLLPAPDIHLNHPPLKTAPRPKSNMPARAQQNRNSSPKPGQVTMMVARPKILATAKRPDITDIAGRPIPELLGAHTLRNAAATQDSDVEMADAATAKQHVSPRGMKIWQTLLDSVEATDEESSSAGGTKRVANPPKSRVGSSGSILSRPSGISKYLQRSPKMLPRRRLIDSLVEQTQEESEDDSSDDSSSLVSDSVLDDSQEMDEMITAQANQLLVQETFSQPQTMAAESQGSQVGPRITYSRMRSMLDEQDAMRDLQMGLPMQSSAIQRPRRVGVPSLKATSSFQQDDEDDENTASAIRSVHELRLAGAKNRFMDEVQDFLEQIGSPGKTPAATSMRRSGLLDLASKMKDKNFARQFRDNGVEQKLFVHLGQEADTISGFMLVSLLISVLSEDHMPHIVAQLRRQGITRLLIRLLECQSSIAAVSKDRKSNMSKVAQSLLAEHQSYVLQLPIWGELEPESLSPRTLALKCLEVMVRQTREAGLPGEIFSKELNTSLFAIMNTASDDRCWNLPKDKLAIDFYLATSALESHSLKARTLHDDGIWIRDYLPILAHTIEIALSRPSETFGKLQLLLLRLTLNVTNNNPEASEVFTKPFLISTMAQAAVVRFKQILRFLTEEDLCVILDHLILILGVMINFAEWSCAARESLQNLRGQGEDPLESMIHIFTENREKTLTADSMEETTKNVPFGYLSVLLGYLALLPPIAHRIQNAQPRKTLTPLVLSIEEFIGLHRAVDGQYEADIDGHNPQAGLTERLESLVDKLALTCSRE